VNEAHCGAGYVETTKLGQLIKKHGFLNKLLSRAKICPEIAICVSESTAVVRDVNGFDFGVRQRDLKRRITQNDASQLGHSRALAACMDRPSTVIPPIVTVPAFACYMTIDHLDHACFLEIVLSCAKAAFGIEIKIRHQVLYL
jgi:hypothetical protein